MLPALMMLALTVIGMGLVVLTLRPTHLSEHADRGLRHDRLVRALGLGVAGLTAGAGGWWAMEFPLVRGSLAIPLAVVLGAGIGYLAVLTVGQLAWPRPSSPTRRAGLIPRGVGDVAGARGMRLIAVPLVVLVLAVVLPAALAPLDGPSAGTREIYRASWDQPPSAVVTVRDVLGLGWPGLRYGLPVLLATLVLLLLAGLALRAVADRPTVVDGGIRWDRAMRATAARRIVTVTAGVLAAEGGLLILAAGSRLMETGTGVVVPAGTVLLGAGVGWAAAGVLLATVGVLWPVRAGRRSAGPTVLGALA